MAASIWSAPVETLKTYPLKSFIRFCDNHGLIQLSNRPQWRTVKNGSIEYVKKILNHSFGEIRLNDPGESFTGKTTTSNDVVSDKSFSSDNVNIFILMF